ncbi:ABC transporter ATP-binding protein [Apilactobacillus timberlakei]|uniref:ATP-binding cassette domain-containing protein n=1 Tax=Apilactobacillus timberlakei TaxID=2008380 RepID=UPI0011298C91|nr:ABC transporter ATP-binding protein [Apilactobacillus timberlakei]TPR23227.1 ABC transporter ATP-binding protein [Apilactobacillus timberlakei]
MIRYLLNEKMLTIGDIILQTLLSLLKVLSAIFSALMLQSLIAKNMQALLAYTCLSILTWILFATGYGTQKVVQEKIIQNVNIKLRNNIMLNVSSMPPTEFHKKDSSDYSSNIINDISLLDQQGFTMIFLVFGLTSDATFSFITLLTYHWSLVLLTIILSIVTTYLPQIMSKSVQKASMNLSNENERLLVKINNVLKGFDTLYAFNMTNKIVQVINDASKEVKIKKILLTKKQSVATFLGIIGNVIGQILTMGWTGFLVIKNLTSVGTVMAATSLSSNIYNGLSNVGPAIVSIKGAQKILYKIESRGKTKNIIYKKNTIDNFDLKLKQLKVVNNDVVRLNDVTTDIKWRDKVAIIGESGSGKSTLLNVIAGKIKDYKGSITLGGIELSCIDPIDIRKHILYMDQTPYIFSGSVRYNITLGENYTDEEVWVALRKIKMDHFVQKMEHGLDSSVGENGNIFSGGQCQRLAIARAFIRHMDILLLDEGTNSLSRDAAIEIENILLSRNDMTLIFVTHQLHDENKEYFTNIVYI